VLLGDLLPLMKFYAGPAAFLRPVVATARCRVLIAVAALHAKFWNSRSARALRCLDRCEAPERTRPASSYIRVDTLGLRGPALGRYGAQPRSALAGKCSARYLAPRYCTLLNHTQGISHKPLRRAGAFQAAAYSSRRVLGALRQAPSENPLAPSFVRRLHLAPRFLVQ